MGIYLGPSPNHARSVQLVLSMYNGNVLPQIHLYFDDMFETKREKTSILPSQWQMKTVLVTNNQAAGSIQKYDNLASNNQSGSQGQGSGQGHFTPDNTLDNTITEMDSDGADKEQQQAPTAEYSFGDTEGEKVESIRQHLEKYRTMNPWKTNPEDGVADTNPQAD